MHKCGGLRARSTRAWRGGTGWLSRPRSEQVSVAVPFCRAGGSAIPGRPSCPQLLLQFLPVQPFALPFPLSMHFVLFCFPPIFKCRSLPVCPQLSTRATREPIITVGSESRSLVILQWLLLRHLSAGSSLCAQDVLALARGEAVYRCVVFMGPFHVFSPEPT